MSNPTTNYITNVPNVGYQDLSGIFLPVSAGSSIGYNTGFNVSGYGDFQNIFASISGGQGIGYNTGYTVNGVGDLSTIFSAYTNVVVSGVTIQYTTYNNTNYGYVVVPGPAAPAPTNLYGSSIPSSQPNPVVYPMPTQKPFTITPILPNITINFILVGGGAGGGGGATNFGSNNGGAGGGGAGGFCQGSFIGNQNNVYSVTVGGGGGGGYFNPNVNYQNGNNSWLTPGGPGGDSNISFVVNNVVENISVTGGSNYGYYVPSDQYFYNGPWTPSQSQGQSGQGTGFSFAPAASGNYIDNPTSGANITVAGEGGRGGYGIPNQFSTPWAYLGNIAMLGATSTASIGSLGSNYTLNYLGNNIYVGGGGSGAYAKNSGQIPSSAFGAPGGGSGGVPEYGKGKGGDANSTYVGGKGYYGGGGGGAAWGGTNSGLSLVPPNPAYGATGNGGAGAPGVAIIWWEV